MPTRLPRIADYAVERARLTVVPRRSTPAPRMPFMILVALVLLLPAREPDGSPASPRPVTAREVRVGG